MAKSNRSNTADRQPKPAGRSEDRPTLTTRQGHPVHDNQAMRSVGERGPATLENYQFIEKITHFDRERVPERVVHARGTGAHGWFEACGTIGDEPAANYTRAKVLTPTGVRAPVFVRFSTVIGVGGDLKDCPDVIRERMVWHLWHCDEDYGRRVAEVAGVDLERAKALQPLPGKPAPHQHRIAPTYASGRREEAAGSDEPQTQGAK